MSWNFEKKEDSLVFLVIAGQRAKQANGEPHGHVVSAAPGDSGDQIKVHEIQCCIILAPERPLFDKGHTSDTNCNTSENGYLIIEFIIFQIKFLDSNQGRRLLRQNFAADTNAFSGLFRGGSTNKKFLKVLADNSQVQCGKKRGRHNQSNTKAKAARFDAVNVEETNTQGTSAPVNLGPVDQEIENKKAGEFH